ncbi:unnamed protein product [Zymoseptoria tritici ST99CH_3D7]|uniref:Uncharacterized protein n=1 Tax=Zymoseptoria tritici (strain ST99CH_3D7) TaxID=1276538 RepID=A0A1X7RCD6_ZYMT9|nr:unnamed protein product [Zymoseptoria tritici ST99CH_3D7]
MVLLAENRADSELATFLAGDTVVVSRGRALRGDVRFALSWPSVAMLRCAVAFVGDIQFCFQIDTTGCYHSSRPQ